MIDAIKPHGGVLVNRIAPEGERGELLKEAASLPKVRLDSWGVSDLEMIAIGAFSPLDGYMGSKDYLNVIRYMRLANDLPWSIPVTLDVSRDEALAIDEGKDAALVDESGKIVGLLNLEEKYNYDKQEEALLVYKTADPAHPGVKHLYTRGDILLGGKITLLQRRAARPEFAKYALNPNDTRELFSKKGWKSIVGFQTRNPVHRAHEYIQKVALEMVDGLFLHPLVGETKGDDIPADVRMRCYEVLLEGYYPKDRVALAINPAAMRYAGPKEAIFHALIRKNYGCTHFIVGRDHAGVGNYYGSYDAQHIFSEFSPGELGIVPLFFENTFYCRTCGGMASAKTCPHDTSNHVVLSGTKVREMLRNGEAPPPEYSRPEVAKILIQASKVTSPAR